MKITSGAKAKAKTPAKKSTAAKPKAKVKTAAKNGGYIAPRRPASSGGEGATASTYTPAYRPVSSGGESGGGGGGYVYVPAYTGGGVSYGGE